MTLLSEQAILAGYEVCRVDNCTGNRGKYRMYDNYTAQLVKILPPPNVPLDTDESILARNEGILRIRFPSDFVNFGRLYGSGTIDTKYSWEIWSPFRRTYPLIVMEFARTWNIFREAMEVNDVPFGIFPEEGGILPFAKTPDGNWVCWRTLGDSEEWGVVDLGQYETGSFEELSVNFSGYFVSVLTRRIVLKRHKNGSDWDFQHHIAFRQEVFADQGY